jgi:hypothetical protein
MFIKYLTLIAVVTTAPIFAGNESLHNEESITLPTKQRLQELVEWNCVDLRDQKEKFLYTFAHKKMPPSQVVQNLNTIVDTINDTYVVQVGEWEHQCLMRILFVDHRDALKKIPHKKTLTTAAIPFQSSKKKEHID